MQKAKPSTRSETKNESYKDSTETLVEQKVKQAVESAIKKELPLQIYELELKISQKLEQKEIKIIEVLAIFITLFTFISVNVNIFTRVNDIYTAIWFMFLMSICSIIMLSVLFFLIHNKEQWREMLAIILFLILITGWLILPQLNLFKLHLNPIETKIENNTSQSFFK